MYFGGELGDYEIDNKDSSEGKMQNIKIVQALGYTMLLYNSMTSLFIMT